ncbi:MAG: hypothetical protein Q8J78_03495 [Moraxellaceae bacterium]|nr:hypothetical protein [Moraxellaceae bacterium]
MSRKPHPKASALLDAHVAFITEQLTGKSLQALIEEEVDLILADAEKITLNEAVTRDMIKDTARGYAVELELSGAIPELVGDIARALYNHPVHQLTTLGDLLPDHLFEEFLDKVLELREVRERLIHEAVANPVYAALASDVLVEGLRDYARQGRAFARQLPGADRAARLGQSLLGTALPMLEETLEENARKFTTRTLESVLQRSEHFLLHQFGEDRLRMIALEIWDVLRDKPVSTFKRNISSLDMEEFFVIGYETWREIRTTPFYGVLIDAGVDAFFDKYGDSSLSELLQEMGIDREIILRDAMRFAPPVLKMLKKKKLLEPVIRRNLEKFYRSAAVSKILDSD